MSAKLYDPKKKSVTNGDTCDQKSQRKRLILILCGKQLTNTKNSKITLNYILQILSGIIAHYPVTDEHLAIYKYQLSSAWPKNNNKKKIFLSAQHLEN